MNPPELVGDEGFYLESFWDLSTCRNFGMGVGPIPWLAIIEYARHLGFDDLLSNDFCKIIKDMDNIYIDWYNKQQAKKTK